MFDHVAIHVADHAASRAFHAAALAPLGLRMLRQFGDDGAEVTPDGHDVEAVCHAAP